MVPLAASGEPNVLLNLFSGDAETGDGSQTQVFSYDAASGTYTETEHEFYDQGYKLQQLTSGGPYRFVFRRSRVRVPQGRRRLRRPRRRRPAADPGLADDTFTDVTRRYPALITKDAAHWWKRVVRYRSRGNAGLLPAWGADEENLGQMRSSRGRCGPSCGPATYATSAARRSSAS